MNALLSPRERILETARTLFYAHGFRAIGVDRLIAESGVAKMTFYKHFPSKDDLIRAYLEGATLGFEKWIRGVIAGESSPQQQLEAIFEGVAKISSSPKCLGCTFMHAAAEFPDATHPGHAVALEYKKGVLNTLEGLTTALNISDPHGLAQDLMMLMDGAWAASRMFGPGNYSSRAAVTAKILIAAQLS